MNKTIKILLGILVIYTTVRFGYLAVQPPGFIPRDFSVFLKVVDRWYAGELVYQAQDASPFKYSPTFLILFAWTFAQFSAPVAWFLWAFVSVAGFAWSVSWLFQWGLSPIPKKVLYPPLFVALGIAWHGFIEHFSYGQVDMILFVLSTLSVWSFERARNRSKKSQYAHWLLAAACLGLCMITKPQSGLLCAYFVLLRKWRFLFILAGVTLFLLFIPALSWGLSKHIELFWQWEECLRLQQTTEFLTGNLNQTPAAVLSRIFGQRDSMLFLFKIFLGLATLGPIGMFLYKKRDTDATMRAEKVYAFCFTQMLYMVATPLSWRWLTFIWFPITTLLFASYVYNRAKFSLGMFRIQTVCFFLFALFGALHQKIFATPLGITEVDDLSYWGVYCWANFLLFFISCLGLLSRSDIRVK